MAPRLPRGVVERGDRLILKPALHAPPPVARRLLSLLRHTNPSPRDVAVKPTPVGGVPAELLVPQGVAADVRMVFFHGGGYRVGSPATHRALVAHLAKAAGVAVLSVDYRLAPEHPYPAGVEDALSVWEAVGATGVRAVVGGDSAGAGLALAATVAGRDRGLPAPAGLALISPWIDLAMRGRSYADNARAEAVLTPGLLRHSADDYRGGLAADDPRCSPLYGEIAPLPPILVHSGTNDLLLSDCQSLVERVSAAGGKAQLRVFDGMWHDFHVHAGAMREADEAVAEMGTWIAARLGLN